MITQRDLDLIHDNQAFNPPPRRPHPLRAALKDVAGIGFIVLFAVWMLLA